MIASVDQTPSGGDRPMLPLLNGVPLALARRRGGLALARAEALDKLPERQPDNAALAEPLAIIWAMGALRLARVDLPPTTHTHTRTYMWHRC